MRLAVLALTLALVGCDDPERMDAGLVDAGPPDAGSIEPPAPEAPAAPEAPRMTPCPDGWSEVAVGGATACEPWAVDRAACPAGTWRFPGDADCAPLGAACPSDGWPAGLDEPSTVFVRAGADAGGDGTRAAPLATIAEGIAAAPDGGTVAIAEGTYDEQLSVDRAVTLRGACVGGVTVAPSAPEAPEAAITLSADGAAVEDLSIGGAGWGVLADSGASTVARIRIAGGDRFGLVASAEGALVAEAVVVEDVDMMAGAGVMANEGGALTLRRGLLERVGTFGALASGEGSSLTLEDVAIRAMRPGPSSLGNGVVASGGATVSAERVVVEGALAAGVFAQGAGGVALTDVVVRGTRPAGRATGFGVSVGTTPTTVERVTIDDNFSAGLLVVGADVSGSDVIVHGTDVEEDVPEEGAGISLHSGGTATLARVWLEGNHSAGVKALGEGTDFSLEDVTIRSTRPHPDGYAGQGVSLSLGPHATLRRALVDDCADIGVLVNEPGTRLDAEDLTVIGTASRPLDGAFGRALNVQLGASAAVIRAHFAGNHEVAVLSYGAGSTLTLEDARIDDTLPRECATSTCEGAGGGSGLAAVAQGRLELTRFRTGGNELAGLQVARDGVLVIQDGVVERNAVGLNIQLEAFDPDNYTQGVLYRDNGRNLDSATLYLPTPQIPE